MCDFRQNMRKVTEKKWKRGYKLTRKKNYSGFTRSYCVVVKDNVPVQCVDWGAEIGDFYSAPSRFNEAGFYLYCDLKSAILAATEISALYTWSFRVQIQEVWYKGDVVYGTNRHGYSGVRAEQIVFRKSRRRWNKEGKRLDKQGNNK